MKVDNAYLSNLGVAIPNAFPEPGDSTLNLPPLVLGAIEPIAPMLRIVGSGATAEQSINAGVQVNRNNQTFGNNTLVTLGRGLYELDMFINARFNFTGAGGTVLHTYIVILNPGLSAGSGLVGFHASIGNFSANRKFRLLCAEPGWTIRFDYGATGVAENLDAYANVQVTKIL